MSASSSFMYVRAVGTLLPARMLERMTAPGTISCTRPEDYGSGGNERLKATITRDFDLLSQRWRDHLVEVIPPCREHPLVSAVTHFGVEMLAVLGYEPIPFGATELDGKPCHVSHRWADLPIHLVADDVPLERIDELPPQSPDTAPHDLLQTYLNQSEHALWGILSNGRVLRVLRKEGGIARPAFLEFDLEGMFTARSFADFEVLWLTLHVTRFQLPTQHSRDGHPSEPIIERWHREAIEDRTRFVGSLRSGVIHATNALGRGFLAHPDNVWLRERVATHAAGADEYYRELLLVIYRLLFLMIAEARGLLHPPDVPVAIRDHYRQTHSIGRLQQLARVPSDDTRSDLFDALKCVMAALGGESLRSDLGLSPLGGHLWSSRSTRLLSGSALANRYLLEAVRAISQACENHTIDWRDCYGLELGSIHEHLLAARPAIDVLADLDSDRFGLETNTGHTRQTTGSFYTRSSSVVRSMLEHALDSVIDDRMGGLRGQRAADALLDMRICDPAVGCGHFLVAAAHRLAARIANLRTGQGRPGESAHQAALREVIHRCLYGIDINPISVELCKMALWIEALDAGQPMSLLDDHIRMGNSLIGATPELIAAGVPDEAFEPHSGDSGEVCAALRRRNSRERKERVAGQATFGFVGTQEGSNLGGPHAVAASGDESRDDVGCHAKLVADAWCAAFLWRKDGSVIDGHQGITDSVLREIERHPERFGPGNSIRQHIDRLAARYRFLHLHLAFPEVFSSSEQRELRTSDSQRQTTGFDCILGNPPFLNQLESATASTGATAAIVRVHSRGLVKGYTDLSAAFLYFSTRWVRDGGRVSMIQPQSLLAARDAAPVRQSVLTDCALTALWISNEHVFEDASVFVCAPTLMRGGPRRGQLKRSVTAQMHKLPDCPIDQDALARSETWSHLAAKASGIPELALEHLSRLSEVAGATADFRDQYYGLDGFLVEDDRLDAAHRNDADYPRIVTTGLIDLAVCHWGAVPTRILKTKWNAPRIDRARMERDGALGPWIANRAIPKVIVATQTKVIEVLVDEAGVLVPSIPLITVQPHQQSDLWLVAAAVASPVASAIALCKYAGAALNADSIKLSAKQVLTLPQPCDRERWVRGARALEDAHMAPAHHERLERLREFGSAMSQAYGLPIQDALEVERWWYARRARDTSAAESEMP